MAFTLRTVLGQVKTTIATTVLCCSMHFCIPQSMIIIALGKDKSCIHTHFNFIHLLLILIAVSSSVLLTNHCVLTSSHKPLWGIIEL